MQYCSSESTIELGWGITYVWYTQDACRAARAVHQMETLRVRLLLVWSDIGTYATRDSMFACPSIRTRDASTDLANLWRKRHWKIIIGHPRVSQLHFAKN